MEIRKEEQRRSYAIKLTACKFEHVIGWVYLYIVYNDLHEEPYGLMENLFVEDAHRGKGVGTALIKEVLEEAKARKCYKVIAQSRHSKAELHALYERFGFRNHGLNFRIDFMQE